MDQELTKLLDQWTAATAKAPWGVQKVFHDVFTLASEGKTTLIYGSDYREGNPCLVNTVGTMLSATKGEGGHGLPSAHFPQIVSLFDRINYKLEKTGVNTKPGYVSPLAAEVFIHHFCEVPESAPEPEKLHSTPTGAYIEPSDEEFARDIANAFMIDVPVEVVINENSFNSVEVNEL